MAKLDDLRARLRTGELEAELEAKRDQRDRRYKINQEGSDALLKFGAHHGLTLRQIKATDPTYLDWMLRESGFPDELKDVIRYIQTTDDSDVLRKLAKNMDRVATDLSAISARRKL